MSDPAIEIRGLTKDYPVGFWRKRMRRSLDNLTLQVEEGEIFGFLGPNGAGKTTTLKLLIGLIFPTAGTARIRGRSARRRRAGDERGGGADNAGLPPRPELGEAVRRGRDARGRHRGGGGGRGDAHAV